MLTVKLNNRFRFGIGNGFGNCLGDGLSDGFP